MLRVVFSCSTLNPLTYRQRWFYYMNDMMEDQYIIQNSPLTGKAGIYENKNIPKINTTTAPGPMHNDSVIDINGFIMNV